MGFNQHNIFHRNIPPQFSNHRWTRARLEPLTKIADGESAISTSMPGFRRLWFFAENYLKKNGGKEALMQRFLN